MGKLYICSLCKDECESVWTDRKAEEEAINNFGANPKTNPKFYEQICDDCYRKIMKWVEKQNIPINRAN